MTSAPIPCPRPALRTGLAALASAAFAMTLSVAPAQAEGPASEPGQLIETKPALPVPPLTITDLAAEQPASLDAYKGHPLIVNLWATWCGPCVKELPSLVKLAADMKEQGLVVIAISEDRGGKFVVDPFVKDHAITGVPIYLDKTMSTGKALKGSTILPMTILVDANGQEIARAFGDRDWDSPQSKAEIAKIFGFKG